MLSVFLKFLLTAFNPPLSMTQSQCITAGYPDNQGNLNARIHSEDLETWRKLTMVSRLTPSGVFTSEKVNLPAKVTLASI